MNTQSIISTVLVASDDSRLVELLLLLLDGAGYIVVTAENAKAALRISRERQPELVIADIASGGNQLFVELKSSESTRQIPVIILKRPSDQDVDPEADDCLELPFRRQELVSRVEKLIEASLVLRHRREITDLSDDIIFTHDLNGYITSINEAGARFLGKISEDLRGKHLAELIGDHQAEKNIRCATANSTNAPFRWTVWLADADGRTRCLEGISNPIRDKNSVPTEVRCVVRDITERKQAEEALRQSEERYRQMFERNSAIKLLIDPVTGEIVDANHAACEFYRYTLEELRSKNISEINMLGPREVDSNLASAATLEQDRFTFPHRLANGEIRTVEVHSGPVNDNGRTLLYSIIHDVTERKAGEEALRESEQRYRDLFENANDIIYTHDLDGNFTSLNRAGERITGYSRDEACSLNLKSVVVPEQLERVREVIAWKAAQDLPTVYELDIYAKDGRRLSLEVSSRLMRKNGVPTGVQGIARDVTERKTVEERLRASESELRALLSAITDVIIVVDRKGRYLKIAPTTMSLLYSPREAMLGKTLHDIFPKWRADRFLGYIEQALVSGARLEVEYSLEIRGRELWFAATISPMDENQVVWIARDITERKATERAVEEQFEREALLNRLTAAVRRSLHVSSVFQTAVEELGQHLQVDRCALYVKDAKAGIARKMAEYHGPEVLPARQDFELGPLADVIAGLDRDGVLVFEDVKADSSISDFHENYLAAAGVRSIMYVAIRVGNEMQAAFSLSTTTRQRCWTESDIALARAFADQTGIAIRQAELFQRAEATYTREALINRLGLAIRASLSIPEILNTATRELVLALDASRAHVFLYDPAAERSPAQHEFVAPGSQSVRGFTVEFNTAIGQHLRKTHQPIVINDSLQFEEGNAKLSKEIRSYAGMLGTRSQIIFPLIVSGQFRGALCIHQTDRPRTWTDDEIALVHAVASQLVTGMAQAELFEMTRRAKTEWETTFNAMSDGIFLFDKAGQLIRVNRTGAAIEDTWPHLMVGKRCCNILRVTEADECMVDRVVRDGRSETVEVTPQRYNKTLLVTVEPIFGSDGSTIGAVCTARDLSELRKAEAVARERQSLLTNILESVREPICAIDIDGRFMWSNGSTSSVMGFAPEELIGRQFTEIIHPADTEMARANFERALRGEMQSYEVRIRARGGETRFALLDNSPLVTEGQITGVLCIARDITEQKQQRQRVAQADKLRALGQLASGVAHDFNNALAAILGRAQLMAREISDPRMTRNVEIIRTAAQDAANTVRRIQTFARQTKADEFELTDVTHLLRDAVEITRTRWENEARTRGLNIDVELNANVPCFTMCNASELREVFVNLIVNAVDAMPLGGKLTVSCERLDERVRLRFADSGSGMNDEIRERIFEPFYTTKGLHGTGLGLAVSYGIIERHKGTITVESEAGKGTTFEIELRAYDKTIAEMSLKQSAHSPSLSILVVDDEEFVRETLSEMLEILNHRVVTADSGPKALETFRSGARYDMVFSDLSMPEMDGWEFAREVRRQAPGMNIVLVTGYGPGTQPPSGEKGLINYIIGKPFDFTQISEAIARVSQHHM